MKRIEGILKYAGHGEGIFCTRSTFYTFTSGLKWPGFIMKALVEVVATLKHLLVVIITRNLMFPPLYFCFGCNTFEPLREIEFLSNPFLSIIVKNNKRVKFTASVAAQRFSKEINFLMPPGHVDVEGDYTCNIQRDRKSVICFSLWYSKRGWKEIQFLAGVQTCYIQNRSREEETWRIPGYDYYKQMFKICDNFNKGLHDKSWPFKAGGKGVKGASGTENAFSMACILQNTFNAFHQITGRDSN